MPLFTRCHHRIKFTLIVCLSAVLCGCAAYEWGRPAELAARSIFIAPVGNETELPQVAALLNAALREAFLEHGGYTLAPSRARADAVVEITLRDLERAPRARLPTDTVRAASYDLSVSAAVSVTKGGEAHRFRVAADTVSYLSPSLPDAEYQGLPRLAQDLAQRIRDNAIYRW
ncbi:MAG: hypothetical protein JJT96_02990 [Opitutales bacterium]|nr:hypothetical protein [Opitutales bacterium]